MYEDPIVDEVRKTRERLAKKFNYDIDAIFEDLRKRQVEWGSRLVYREKKPRGEQPPTPER
ncbi:MAG: hypothetical protein FJ280_03220 [Planctomycetes bacterium]|nr:hypothetical protein [Planctomycetota bacterium]